MTRPPTPRYPRIVIILALLFGIFALAPVQLRAQPSPLKSAPELERSERCSSGQSDCTARSSRSIIMLRSPSIAEVMMAASEVSPPLPSGQLSVRALEAGKVYATALKRTHAQARQKFARHSINVSHTFSITLNALVIDRKLSLVEAQQLLPGEVLSVIEDRQVRAFLSESVPLTKASELWKMATSAGIPLSGHGVRIGIIDTGIDYTHADLGGCARTTNINTSGCSKVLGGYDFVNRDNDPFDDHGHGTHCAAIAAGKGSLSGVAPDAALYAYKVLSGSGSGSMSDVIAAIERSADPNGDGNPNDRLDVISLSLGSPNGDPNDPDALALDRAMSLGVTAVVAAGNEGSAPETISSPGTSRRALTVGALSKSKTLAGFSSRGPVPFDVDGKSYTISKPDVIAPGVDICAARGSELAFSDSGRLCLDTIHLKLSGTSMATPHVAGVAALLRQAHPTWSADEVKSAIVSSASLSLLNSSQGVNDAGSGAVDAVGAYGAARGFVAIEDIQTDVTVRDVSLRVPVGWAFNLSTARDGDLRTFETATWTTVVSGVAAAPRVITPLDISSLSSGAHALRLTATSPSGATLTDYSSLTVQRFDMVSPKEADVVNIHEPLQVRLEKLLNVSVDNLIIDYAINGDSWQTTGVTTSQANLSGSIDLPPSTQPYTLKVRSRITTSGGEEAFVSDMIRVDPALKPGFPIRVETDCVAQSWWGPYCQPNWVLHPIVADLEGDRLYEIVVWRNNAGGKTNEILIFDHKGVLIRSFALSAHPIQTASSENQFVPWPLLVTDLDNDGFPEIVVVESFWDTWSTFGAREWQVISVYDRFGTVRPGFPVLLNGINEGLLSADLNRDGRKEIILTSIKYLDLQSPQIRIVSDDGTICGASEIERGSARSGLSQIREGASSLVGNFDEDEDLEIAVFQNTIDSQRFTSSSIESQVSIVNWNHFGKVLPVVPPISGFLWGSAAVQDEDKDGVHELTIPTENISQNTVQIQHLLFNSMPPSANTLSAVLVGALCSTSTPSFCGAYSNGFALGRLRDFGTSVLGFSGNLGTLRTQLHRFVGGQLAANSGEAFSAHFPDSPPVAIDVTGDRKNDIIFVANEWPSVAASRGVVVLTSDSQFTSTRVFATEGNGYGQGFFSPSVVDIDRDGKVDLIAGSLNDRYLSRPGERSYKNRFSLYAFSTDGAESDASGQWRSFLGNPDHNGCLDCERAVVSFDDPAPIITQQPRSTSIPTEQSITLSVQASGANVRYQWERALSSESGWFPITDAQAHTVTVPVNGARASSYRVRVSSLTRSTMSEVATVVPTSPTPSPPTPKTQVCPAGSPKKYAGVCGCLEIETDNDSDGVTDCLERELYKDLSAPIIHREKRGKVVTINLPVIAGATRYSIVLISSGRGKERGTRTIRRSGKSPRFTFSDLRGGAYTIKWTASVAGVPSLSKVSGPSKRFIVKRR